MARHDLLSILGFESLKGLLEPKPDPAWGRMDEGIEDRALRFSFALGEKVLEHFLQHKSFLKSHPILLGSWARGELTPGSDLDLLFLGPESEVREVVAWAQGLGLKIRSRVPENPDDLGQGVELWDRFSLLDGLALTDLGRSALDREQRKLFQAKARERKAWLKELVRERIERHRRFDSIQNLLQPQIKMGLGGLRDLHQARILERLFPEVAARSAHSRDIFSFYLQAFLWIRILLHLEGENDLLSNASQPAIARRLGFRDYHELMLFVQKGLSRVSFYSDWLLEACAAGSAKKIKALKKPADTGALLRKDPSVLAQHEVRQNLDKLWSEKSLPRRSRERGRELLKFFPAKVGEEAWIALFRSRLMDRLLPQLNALIGYVQHDQYHRYTADAHVLQVLRQVLRARKSSKILGPLKFFTREFSNRDWNLLLWTALYHDLAKGRPEDHSELGEEWVRRDLKSFGLPKVDVDEVAWLVRHHLVFSQAALRRDPQDGRVLAELSRLGLSAGRIRRLLVFTALDILGTNPDSWNEWKAKLLADLGGRLLSPDRQVRVKLFAETQTLTENERASLMEIGQEIGLKNLKDDLAKVRGRSTASFDFYKQKNRRLWVRYHHSRDEKGTLARVLGLLFQSGASVLKATVLTLPEIGVYDWFCLEDAGKTEALKKRLEILANQKESRPPQVTWEKVSLVAKDADSWTLLFKGMDQRGLLWDAARRLSDAGLEIRSAVVQTWGKKAEDLFVVKAAGADPGPWLEKISSSTGPAR